MRAHHLAWACLGQTAGGCERVFSCTHGLTCCGKHTTVHHEVMEPHVMYSHRVFTVQQMIACVCVFAARLHGYGCGAVAMATVRDREHTKSFLGHILKNAGSPRTCSGSRRTPHAAAHTAPGFRHARAHGAQGGEARVGYCFGILLPSCTTCTRRHPCNHPRRVGQSDSRSTKRGGAIAVRHRC